MKYALDARSVIGALNSRQDAILFWAVVFAIFSIVILVRNKSDMAPIRGAIKALLSRFIIVPILLVVCWNVGVIFLLQYVGYWDETMLWDSVSYISFGAIGSMVLAADAIFDRAFFRKSILKNGSVIFLVGFAINLFTLGWLDFLLVPFLFILGGLIAVAGSQKENRDVLPYLNRVQWMLGGLLILYSISHLVFQFREVATTRTIETAALPFVLSLTFGPLLFLLCTWIAYSDAFIPLRLARGLDRRMKGYAKRRIFFRYRLDLPLVQEFRAEKGWALASAKSRQEVDDALDR